MTDTTGTEVETAGGDVMPAAGTAAAVTTDSEIFQRFLAAADDAAAEVDPESVTLEIVAGILGATSADDVLGGRDAIHAGDYLNSPFTLLDVKFNQSTFTDNGPAFYAVLAGADPDGVPVTITCGAKNVIAQAWKLKDLQALPIGVQIEQSPRPTAAGNHVMWLAKPTKSF